MEDDVKRVALFGGSFNPIHNGHIAIARAVLRSNYADEVWLLVSPQNPLKSQRELCPEQVRLKIAQLALQDEQGIKVSDFEFTLSRPSYTWNTLQLLNKKYPYITFSLLVGGDNWINFNQWAHNQDILKYYKLVVYPRPENPINAADLPANVSLLNAPLYPYSSTDVRKCVKEGKSIESMVPKRIEQLVLDSYK